MYNVYVIYIFCDIDGIHYDKEDSLASKIVFSARFLGVFKTGDPRTPLKTDP